MTSAEPSPNYLAAARQGMGAGWLYVVCILGIEWIWSSLGGYVAWISQAITIGLFRSKDIGIVCGSFFPFVMIIAMLAVIVRKWHKRPLMTLVNAEGRLNYKRLGIGFAVWLGLLLIFTVPFLWIAPQDYRFTSEPGAWFAVLPFLLILVPLQTSAEELLYRGYLMQGLSLLTKNPVTLTIATSVAFAIPHFSNPEMQRGFVMSALTYLLWGIFFAVISLRDNGLELALGAHAANNLFVFIGVSAPDSVVATPALLTYVGPLHAGEDFMSLLLYTAIFYGRVFWGIPRQTSSGPLDIKANG